MSAKKNKLAQAKIYHGCPNPWQPFLSVAPTVLSRIDPYPDFTTT